MSYRVVGDYYRQEHFDFFRSYEMPFFEDSGRLMVPVGLGVNHIFIDGAAIGALVNEVQEEFDNPS